ncbi:hypothetical protein SPRG_10393 [Saprolegnia parasitica CBS 223.65]|uniref:B box-type domain-containing protein n=1 Tax=Saprolegnia parasitica (strain CBS 223.65) TaxID=695850 RepID=A0A067C1C7_SAPPC|nr:hypothetical protein SPRG_10393 [Saprolegnia parasitica CBS 223.65]KDO24318.1 hypothetical protein SPRG_10393 [Saprolegnia parasitica CBS 223.65]|eukprot:XP_012204915.1 hypothetical protein SPRG_10393 [Saprolegnia parasitica CBS 223.65]
MADYSGISRLRRLSELLDHDDGESDGENHVLPVSAVGVCIGAAEDETMDDDDDVNVDTTVCIECRHQRSEVFCEQCHDHFCRLCYGGQHRKGNRKTHTFQPILQSTDDAREKIQPAAPTVPLPSTASSRPYEGDADSSDDSDDSGNSRPSRFRGSSSSRNICTLMGSLLLGGLSSKQLPSSSAHAVPNATMRDRARYIPVRLTYEERKRLRTLEAALSVCHYTDKIDTLLAMNPSKRTRLQLQEIAGFLSGLVVSMDYKAGQTLLDEKQFEPLEGFFGDLFELGRRYKIMNPEKMRGEYGALMYLLQDAVSPAIHDLLGFSPVKPLKTVYAVLEAHGVLGILDHPLIETATMVVAPEGKSRAKIQQQIKAKDAAIKEITRSFFSSSVSADEIQQCLYSIADNNYHLYFERDPIDRMITLLTTHFPSQDTTVDAKYSLAIVSGSDGARLSHSHARQYHYVLQSLTLWREIAHDMFRLWCLTDDDLLTAKSPYQLTDTGQGLHRIQASPLVSRAMHVLLHTTQERLEHWVGSSVIHLGDKNVPNALMFIDKYAQVGHILRPIVKTIDAIDELAAKSAELQKYIATTFGGPETLKKDILVDFFREAFDGSGADNFFDAGSCIDGRLTSAWNWCSRLHAKKFFPVFKLAGFVGFDGKFG